MTNQPSAQTLALYAALTGADYCTGVPKNRAYEFSPENQKELELAEKFLEEYPEVKEAVEIIERRYSGQIRSWMDRAKRYRLDRNNLAWQLNDANAELGRESNIEYYD